MPQYNKPNTITIAEHNSRVMTVRVGSAGYILHERERSYYGAGTGWLSVKSFYGGHAFYEVGHSRYVVDDHRYLLLNHGQPYTIQIEANTAVESFCIFFAPGFAQSIRQTSTQPDHCLLDAPISETAITFFEKTYPHDDVLTPALERLRATYATAGAGRLEEQFHDLMGQLLQVHFNVYREIERLPAARPATREELYRRVQCARDYIFALYRMPITLDDIAQAACLSPNHLLRTFKQVFRQTPHQLVTELRLEEAQRLLLHTELPVTEICFAIGFESLGTFSALFRRRFRVSPSQFRRQNR